MGPLTFNSQLYPHLKQTWSFSLLPPSSSPAYALSQNLKPRLMPSHGWLTPTTDMLDIHMLLDMLDTHTLPPMVLMLVPMPQLSMVPDMPLTPPHTTPMVLLTSSARDLLTPNQKPGMELTDTLPHTLWGIRIIRILCLSSIHLRTCTWCLQRILLNTLKLLKSKLVTFYLL